MRNSDTNNSNNFQETRATPPILSANEISRLDNGFNPPPRQRDNTDEHERATMELDISVAMTKALGGMTLHQSTFHNPTCDGRYPPLKEFLQDVQNSAVHITPILPNKLLLKSF